MKKENIRIVFMGTPEFAVESLKSLVENGYNVVAVVTQLISLWGVIKINYNPQQSSNMLWNMIYLFYNPKR